MTIFRSTAGLDDLRVVEVSLAHPDTVTAEHWLASQPWEPVLASTQLRQSPAPHVALTLAFADLPALPAYSALPASAAQTGRAVLFPGVDVLVGTLSVAEILALSAITRVEVLGSGIADPAALVETGDFVRPQWRAGDLVLTTTPAAGDRLVPFETRNPTPCCAAH